MWLASEFDGATSAVSSIPARSHLSRSPCSFGSNSSGKTSIHLPLVLLKQTTDTRDRSIALVTRGRIANVGTYRDLIHRHRSQEELGFEIGFARRLPKSHTGRPSPADLTQLDLDVTRNEVALKSYDLRDQKGSAHDQANPDIQWKVLPCGNEARYIASSKGCARSLPNHFLFEGNAVFAALMASNIHARTPSDIEIPAEVSEYIRRVGWTDRRIKGLLDGISYIGPLREHPRRRYDLSEEMPPHVGMRGQSAPEILFRSQGQRFSIGREVARSVWRSQESAVQRG